MLKPNYSRLAAHQLPTHKHPEKPVERKYEVGVDADGNPTSTEIVVPRSPFTKEQIHRFRSSPIIQQQYQQQRGQDLLAHHRWVKQMGPQLEARLGVTAKQLFKGRNADSAAAAKLLREDPESYFWLKEFSYYC